MFKVKVKWGKEMVDAEVDTRKSALEFKNKLYQLTGVPVERQKIMGKGLWKGTLKDDQELGDMPWKDGQLLGMMGTSTGIPKPPEQEVKFVEDMTAKEKQEVAAVDPPGLQNLGNTCYMNSTIQCMKSIPELRDCLGAAELSASSGDISERMVSNMRSLFREMDSSGDYVTPGSFVQSMRLCFPQFAQTTPRGGFQQQDADEFFNEIVNVLANKLTKAPASVSFEDKRDAISALFGIELVSEMKCMESEDEPTSQRGEQARRLQCNITNDVLTLEQGLKLGFESELEKQSEVLKRNALFKQTRRIDRLPRYLTIQLNRFFWKATPQSRDHTGVNCKILKPVKFSFTLDVYDYCTDDLKAILKGPRDAYAKERMAAGKGDGDVEMEDAGEDDEELKAAIAMSLSSDRPAGIGLPTTFRGIYELFGVVTHKGRASDSGHYIGWVKMNGEGENADWCVFDDETVSHCKGEDILRLSGGGDYDMAYMLFYRAMNK